MYKKWWIDVVAGTETSLSWLKERLAGIQPHTQKTVYLVKHSRTGKRMFLRIEIISMTETDLNIFIAKVREQAGVATADPTEEIK